MILRVLGRLLRDPVARAITASEAALAAAAKAEIEAALALNRGPMLRTMLVLGLLLAASVAAGYLIADVELRRITAGSLALAATLYGTWTFVVGARPYWPHIRFILAARCSPYRLAEFYLYRRVLARLRAAVGDAPERRTVVSRVALSALRLGHGPASWEALAYRLSAEATPRLLRHAALRIAVLFGAPVAAWWVYRLIAVPLLIHDGTGLGPLASMLYPVAALGDWLLGLDLRRGLLA